MTQAASRRVYLHIGLPKTGTTYLQEMLWANRDDLAAADLLYPGETPVTHFQAAVDLQPERYWTWTEPAIIGGWDRLVDDVASWPASSIISHELLTTATRDQAAHALSTLSFAEVHVICTARDLARQIPASWQENIKNSQTMPYQEFLTAVRTGEPAWISEQFWGFQDLPRVLGTWGRSLPPQHVHLVTVPHDDPTGTVLWRRFASVLDIEPMRITNSVPIVNRSMPLAQTELLRRVNQALDNQLAWPEYATTVKERLTDTILPRLQTRGPARIPLPADEFTWVAHRAKQILSSVITGGYHIVGDLTDLLPIRSDDPPLTAEPNEADLEHLAVETIAALVQHHHNTARSDGQNADDVRPPSRTPFRHIRLRRSR